MELKEFVKNVIRDITDAVKESQEELKNGTIVSPTFSGSSVYMDNDISKVDFEVSVIASSTNETTGKIKVFSAWVGGGLESGKTMGNEHTSVISFSVPVILPVRPVKRKSAVN